MRELTARQLHAYLLEIPAAPRLLDVRQPWEFEVCRIEGAILIPMSEVAGRLEELDANEEIVVICHHGVRSRMVGRLLEQHGFTNVINLAGGVDAWARDVDRNMAVY